MISVDSLDGAIATEPITLAMRQVLGNFDRHRQQAVEGESKAWKWQEGVILFPEALCPSCNGVMRSNRIWQVDEVHRRVLKAAFMEAGHLESDSMSRVHPHVDTTGSVCTGDAQSTTEALFFGLGLGSPHWLASAEWYQRVFDHTCSTKSKRRSRNHLSESIKLGEVAKQAKAPVFAAAATPPSIPEVVVVDATATAAELRLAAMRRELRDRLAQRMREADEARDRAAERSLFDGSMAGNTESTGISADDQPSGLRLDRL